MKFKPGDSDRKGHTLSPDSAWASGARVAVKDRRHNTTRPASKDAPRFTAVVLARGEARRACQHWLPKANILPAGADTLAEAENLLTRGDFDLLIVGPDDAEFRSARRGQSPLERLASRHPATAVVVVGDAPAFEDALAAMRAGAADYLACGTPVRDASARLVAAATRAAKRRGELDKLSTKNTKLKRLCKGLSVSRRELNRQVSHLCEHLADAYKDLAGQMNLLKLSAHFETLIRQELELESLLRVAVEFILARTGPTNAAVFLPATSGDLSLGAYVNFDCPRESHEMLLDQLAAAVAPKFEHDESIVRLNSEPELQDRLGTAAEWLDGRAAAAFSCRHEDECLAVVTLFRDQSAPFTEEHAAELAVLAGLFAKQLARVIHVHHRHLPKKKWGNPGDPYAGPDDIDLAA